MLTLAYDQQLADRIRRMLRHKRDVVEKEMFGGLTFMHRGRMSLGIVKDELMVRVRPEEYLEALKLPYARRMDFTGRPLRGFVFVSHKGFAEDADLRALIELGLSAAKAHPRLNQRKRP